ncbi:MAG: hypothetical protein IT317_21675 [Anaerolineales bacterium]|nr:hypothetical protein [Anaerolineales bacterium]
MSQQLRRSTGRSAINLQSEEGNQENMAEGHPRTLGDWETYLAPQVTSAQLRLLGEISLTADDCRQLGRTIGGLHTRRSKANALHELRRRYPCSFITFLVAQGVYGYKAGDYWDGVIATTGVNLSAVDCREWGFAFEEILEELGLPQFPGMGGSRYVSVILAHGGIPDYSLNDFFSNLLHPAVVRPQYADLAREELITELLQRSSADFADKPVRRFLEYGGQVAVNFLERCREMAQEFLETNIVPEASALGLPQRVVEAYRVWISEQDEDKIERHIYRGDDLRLRKPEIVVDPWGQGVSLRLPSQLVPATLSQSSFAWRLKTATAEQATIPVKVRRMGYDLRTVEPQPFRLQRPAAWFQLEFLVDQKTKRTWRIDGLSPERPLLIFDSARATLVNWMHDIPAERAWLLFPADHSASCEGESQFVDLPAGYGAWAEYKLQEWDLTQARRLLLRPKAGEPLGFPIRQGEAALRPTLVGGGLLPISQPTRRTPLYVGQLPSIQIPLIGKHSVEEELRSWRLTIRSRGFALPEINRTLRIDELNDYLDKEPGTNAVRLPLAVSGLLDGQSYGTYDLRLRGPLGRDAELPFRIWHALEVEPLEAIYVPPSPTSPSPVDVRAYIAAEERVELATDEGEVIERAVIDSANRHRLTIRAQAASTILNLTLTRPAGNGRLVQVPVQIPIPRLRWLLTDEASDTQVPAWGGALLSRATDALLQMQQPTLVISVPTADNSQVRLQLRLKDSSNSVLSASSWTQGAAQQREWRFSLVAFFDALRQSNAPVTRFELACVRLPGHDEPVVLPILSVTKDLHVEGVTLEGQVQDGKPYLRLRWRESVQPLLHRHVRIWPVWQPWRRPVELSIPDSARGEYVFPVPAADLPVGRLRLQFTIRDPWITAQVSKQLPPIGTGIMDYVLLTPEMRLRQITKHLEAGPSQFIDHLERAHIALETVDQVAVTDSANWCFSNLDGATPEQALALSRLLKQSGDTKTHLALKLKLFTASRLEIFLQARDQGKVDESTFEEYLANLPAWGQLPIESCLKLLTIDREAVQLAAIQQLVEKRNPAGPKAILERLSRSKLSEPDAVALLSRQGDFALAQLQSQPGNEQILRLLELLAPKLGETVAIVIPGLWIRTGAGWGRIEKIEDANSGRPAQRFLHTDRRHKLWVTLRPSYDAEPVLVDLDAYEIRFLKADRIYTCAKCRHFSARDQQSVVGQHERAAHWTDAADVYSGIGGSVAPEPEPSLILSDRKLAFSFRAPSNQWA